MNNQDLEFTIIKTLVGIESDPYGLIIECDTPNRDYDEVVKYISQLCKLDEKCVVDKLKEMHLNRLIRIKFYNGNGHPVLVTALDSAKHKYYDRLEAETIANAQNN